MTQVTAESSYSGVVSLRGQRIVAFIAELNDLELWGTDIGNAYLKSYTKEKVCFIAGPEFGEREGHLMIIVRAQYGLRSSGARWHDRLFDSLMDMSFRPSKAEDDIWMRDKGDHYKYISVYVDDLAIASRNPKGIIEELEKGQKFKLKGTGPISYHLGCDYKRDEDGTLAMGLVRYIERMAEGYERTFGTKPRQSYRSPLEPNDHPELDDTTLLEMDGIVKQYQSMHQRSASYVWQAFFVIVTKISNMLGYPT